MTELNNDQLTSEASKADFTEFIYIFLFEISVNIGLKLQTFGKEKKGIYLQRQFCEVPVLTDDQHFLILCWGFGIQ